MKGKAQSIESKRVPSNLAGNFVSLRVVNEGAPIGNSRNIRPCLPGYASSPLKIKEDYGNSRPTDSLHVKLPLCVTICIFLVSLGTLLLLASGVVYCFQSSKPALRIR